MTVMNLDQSEVWRLARDFAVTIYKYASTAREAETVARSINGWITYLKKAKTGINEPGANHVIHEIQAPYLTEETTEQD